MILIAEDYPDTARALCLLLTGHGYPCEWVGNGSEAIAYIRQYPPEQPLLVLLDQMMPGMSGTEVLEQLRSDPRTANVGVIMYSAEFDSAKRDECIALGAHAYLLKGTDVTGTIRTICEWYERVGGVRTTAPKSHQ